MKPAVGFKLPSAGVTPAPSERKMRDFVPVRTSWGICPAAGDAVAGSLLCERHRRAGILRFALNDTLEQKGVLAILRLILGAGVTPAAGAGRAAPHLIPAG